jgi:hypothetical protein
LRFSDNGVAQFELDSDSGWDQNADNTNFAGCGNVTATLAGGTNYGGKTDLTTTGALFSGLDDIQFQDILSLRIPKSLKLISS